MKNAIEKSSELEPPPSKIIEFIQKAPKAELHIHLEGCLDVDLYCALAKRNGFPIDPIGLKQKYANLEDFLKTYAVRLKVLRTEQDFTALIQLYCDQAESNAIKHAEIFFEIQTYLENGIAPGTIMQGINNGVAYAKTKGISLSLILCFMRDRPVQEALISLEYMLPFREHIVAVGLASAERNYPPKLFENVFDRARAEGLLTVAHAGEDGPAEYVWQAIEFLKVSRIDHGNHCADDPELVRYIADNKIPLTMCPLSNRALKVIKNLNDFNGIELLEQGVIVCLNSDDPAYFGGYLNQVLIQLYSAQNPSPQQVYSFIANGFIASFIPEKTKKNYLHQLKALFTSIFPPEMVEGYDKEGQE